jgi:protein FRA10AC1
MSDRNSDNERINNPASRRQAYMALDAYSRHKQFINDYYLFYGQDSYLVSSPAGLPAGFKSEREIIRQHHRFIRYEEDDRDLGDQWEKRLAKKYYDKLFKEYCLAELKYYREGRVAMRWRTEQEVVTGKGQFICGSMRCDSKDQLRSWEVNFGYVEDGVKKNALVKLRLCPRCSERLNYGRRWSKKRPAEDYNGDTGSSQAAEEGPVKPPMPDKSGVKRVAIEGETGGVETTNEDAKRKESAVAAAAKHWQKRPAAEEATQLTSKSKAEEFDEFFKDLFE